MKLHEYSRILCHIHRHQLLIFIENVKEEIKKVIELVIRNINFESIIVID